jgi:hypothetical protein
MHVVHMTAELFAKIASQHIRFLEGIGPDGALISIIVRHPKDRHALGIFSTDDELMELVARAFGEPDAMVTQTVSSDNEIGEEEPLNLSKPS